MPMFPLEDEKFLRTGIWLIQFERARQIVKEGFTSKHDEQHESGELLLLAACYILKNYTFADFEKDIESELFAYWGDDELIKYKNPIKDLTRAGALIAAEIDRLLRRDDAASHQN